MKKRVCGLMAGVFWLLSLSGCAAPLPEQAADGGAWSGDWINVGNVLGVEPPGDDLTLLDNNGALAPNDMYYATWTIGTPDPFTNEDGEEVDLYPAQLYTLVYGCTDETDAQSALEEWTAHQEETYTVLDTAEQTYNGQRYTVTQYTCNTQENPYERGISAFLVYGRYAICVEFNCQEIFSEDETAILSAFLEGCHYNATLDQGEI